MPNDYFEFKQFRVEQGNCGMKITTDACVFGAFAGHHFKTQIDFQPNRILDIGTGSGLLALMMAQYFNSQIDAVELDKAAYDQSKINFHHSKWANNLSLFHSSIQNYSKIHSTKKYELIISNPPFFNNSFKPPNKKRLLARHSDKLSYTELLKIGQNLISEKGIFYILLPKIESNLLLQEVEETKLKLVGIVDIYPNPNKVANRVIFILSKKEYRTKLKDIYIKNTGNTYSRETIELLNGFYLYL